MAVWFYHVVVYPTATTKCDDNGHLGWNKSHDLRLFEPHSSVCFKRKCEESVCVKSVLLTVSDM